jgi:hypothetical protein
MSWSCKNRETTKRSSMTSTNPGPIRHPIDLGAAEEAVVAARK